MDKSIVPADGNPAASNLPTSTVLLPDDVLEKLYQSYALKQKRVAFGCYLAASILFDVWAILVPQGQGWESIGECQAVLLASY